MPKKQTRKRGGGEDDPPTAPDETRKRTKHNPVEKELMTRLGVWSCKDIREHLEHTELTREEKIAFIEQNINSSKSLKAYIKKQHYSANELRYMAEAGEGLVRLIGAKAKEIWTMMYDVEEGSDEDCAYLREEMKKFYEEKENEKNTVWSRTLAKTAKAAKGVGKAAMDGAKMVGSAALGGLKLLGQGGFRVYNWIMHNPKTAFFCLIMLKNLKTQLCRLGAKWYLSQKVDTNNKESIKAFIRSYYPEIRFDPRMSLRELKEMLGEKMKPKIAEMAATEVSKVFGDIGKTIGSLFSDTMGTFAMSIPVIGPLIGGSVTLVSKVVIQTVVEDGALLAELALSQPYTVNCFTPLKNLLNPFECLKSAAQEATAIVEEGANGPAMTNADREGEREEEEEEEEAEAAEAEAAAEREANSYVSPTLREKMVKRIKRRAAKTKRKAEKYYDNAREMAARIQEDERVKAANELYGRVTTELKDKTKKFVADAKTNFAEKMEKTRPEYEKWMRETRKNAKLIPGRVGEKANKMYADGKTIIGEKWEENAPIIQAQLRETGNTLRGKAGEYYNTLKRNAGETAKAGYEMAEPAVRAGYKRMRETVGNQFGIRKRTVDEEPERFELRDATDEDDVPTKKETIEAPYP